MPPESRLCFPAVIASIILLPAFLGACAAGSSLSLAQAPVSYVVDDQGGRDVAARDDGTIAALAARTNDDVAGLEAVGGNALLPVSVGLTAGQGSASLNAALPATTANVALAPLNPALAAVAITPTGAATALPAPVDRVLVTTVPLLGTANAIAIRPLTNVTATDSGLLATIAATLRGHH